MMKKLIIAAMSAVALTSCGCGISSVSSLSTMSDSVSYAYGTFVGKTLKNQFGSDNKDLNINILASAIKGAIDGSDALLTDEAIQATLQNYFTVVKPAQDAASDSLFLEDVKANNANIKVTESGLMYEIIEEGDVAVKAVIPDTVSVLYTGTYSNGDVFDSTSNRDNQPAEFALGQVIPGWNEGMQLIGKGGKIKLWIPKNLAYGDKLMMFEVELLDVKKVK